MNKHQALARAVEIIEEEGYTIRPKFWLAAEAAPEKRKGSEMEYRFLTYTTWMNGPFGGGRVGHGFVRSGPNWTVALLNLRAQLRRPHYVSMLRDIADGHLGYERTLFRQGLSITGTDK